MVQTATSSLEPALFVNQKINSMQPKKVRMTNNNKNICIDSKNQKGFVNGMDYKI